MVEHGDVSTGNTSLVAYLAWEVWASRNSNYFENKRFDFVDIMKRAVSRMMEGDVQEERAATRSERTWTVRWKKPEQGKLKMNCDIATGGGDKVGLGFVVRDHEGNVRLAGKKIIDAEGSTTLLEGLALLYGFQMCADNIISEQMKPRVITRALLNVSKVLNDRELMWM